MTTIRATAKRDLEAGVFVTAADVAILGAPIRPMPTWPVGLARAEHTEDMTKTPILERALGRCENIMIYGAIIGQVCAALAGHARRLDLEGADLEGADLYRANLRGYTSRE